MVRKSMRVAKTPRRSSRSAARLDVDVPVSRVMLEDPVCIGPDLSGALARLLMLDQSVGALPVVDAVGRPIGILSKTDIVRRESQERAEEHETEEAPLCSPSVSSDLDSEAGSLRALETFVAGTEEPRVADLMSPSVLSVSESTSVMEAARLMIEHEVHHLPVTGARGKLVGMLSPFDIVRAIARLPGTKPGERKTG
jgi:CBS domain-containing protein